MADVQLIGPVLPARQSVALWIVGPTFWCLIETRDGSPEGNPAYLYGHTDPTHVHTRSYGNHIVQGIAFTSRSSALRTLNEARETYGETPTTHHGLGHQV